MPPYGILGFVTSYSPNKMYKNLIIMGLLEYFCTTVFNICLITVTSNHFPQVIQICKKNNF